MPLFPSKKKKKTRPKSEKLGRFTWYQNVASAAKSTPELLKSQESMCNTAPTAGPFPPFSRSFNNRRICIEKVSARKRENPSVKTHSYLLRHPSLGLRIRSDDRNSSGHKIFTTRLRHRAFKTAAVGAHSERVVVIINLTSVGRVDSGQITRGRR